MEPKEGEQKMPKAEIAFLEKDATCILSYPNFVPPFFYII